MPRYRYIGNENVEAVVLRTGFLTAKGELVRSMLFPKPVDFQLGQDVTKFLWVLAIFAGIGLTYTIVIKVRDETQRTSQITPERSP